MIREKLHYLSPTSLSTYLNNHEDFFLKYMCGIPRPGQTEPMAAGSAFDSCVKAYLTVLTEDGQVSSARHSAAYDKFFEESVEEHCRTKAMHDNGKIIYNLYKRTGALDDLVNDIEPGTAHAISKLEGVIGGVPYLGKPDFEYVSRKKHPGMKVVTDWKCNGALSEHPVSPLPGYVDIWPTRSIHKDCHLVDGVNVLDIHKSHAIQLPIYKLLADAEIVGIEQLVFGKSEPPVIGTCRVAIFRHRVSEALTMEILGHGQRLWAEIQNWESGKSFGSVTAERCVQLQSQAGEFDDPIKRMLTGRG